MICASPVPVKIGHLVKLATMASSEGYIIDLAPPQPVLILREATREEYLKDSFIKLWVNRVGRAAAIESLSFIGERYFYEYTTD